MIFLLVLLVLLVVTGHPLAATVVMFLYFVLMYRATVNRDRGQR